MHCSKCGAETKPGSLFCHKCGARIEEVKAEDVLRSEETVSGDAEAQEAGAEETVAEETAEEETKTSESTADTETTGPDYNRYFEAEIKKSDDGKKKYYIMGAIAVIATVFLLCFCNTNTFKRMFYKPQDYYSYVEKKNAKKNLQQIGAWMDVAGVGEMDKTQGAESSVNIRLSDDIVDTISQTMGYDLSFISDVSMSEKATVYDGLAGSNYSLTLGSEQILTVNTISDLKNNDLYLRIPELSDDYIRADLGEISEYSGLEDKYDDLGGDEGALMKYMSVLESLPAAAKITSVINKYTDIIFDDIDNVKRSGRETLDIGGVEQKCWILSVELDHKDLKKIAKNLREQLEDDKDVEKIITDLAEGAGEHGDVVWDDFTDGLYVIEDMAAQLAGTRMNVYVDSKGRIIYRSIDFGSDEDASLEYGRVIRGREFGAKAAFRADGEEISVEGSGKKAGEKYSGDFTLSIFDEDSVGLTLESFDYKAFKDQKINGEVSVSVKDLFNIFDTDDQVAGLIEDYLAIVKVESPSRSSRDISLRLTDGKTDPVAVTMSLKQSGGTRITVPDSAVDADDTEELKQYLKSADYDRLVNSLENAGVPDELVQYVKYLEQAADYLDYLDLLI